MIVKSACMGPNDKLSILQICKNVTNEIWILFFLMCHYSHCPPAWWKGCLRSSCTISYGVEEEEEGDPGRFGHSTLVVVCCLSIRFGCSLSQAVLDLESTSRRGGWVQCHCVSGNALVATKERTNLGDEVFFFKLPNTINPSVVIVDMVALLIL